MKQKIDRRSVLAAVGGSIVLAGCSDEPSNSSSSENGDTDESTTQWSAEVDKGRFMSGYQGSNVFYTTGGVWIDGTNDLVWAFTVGGDEDEGSRYLTQLDRETGEVVDDLEINVGTGHYAHLTAGIDLDNERSSTGHMLASHRDKAVIYNSNLEEVAEFEPLEDMHLLHSDGYPAKPAALALGGNPAKEYDCDGVIVHIEDGDSFVEDPLIRVLSLRQTATENWELIEEEQHSFDLPAAAPLNLHLGADEEGDTKIWIASSEIQAYDLYSGTQSWTRDLRVSPYSEISDGNIICHSGQGTDSMLFSIQGSSGDEKWAVNDGDRERNRVSGLTVSQSQIFTARHLDPYVTRNKAGSVEVGTKLDFSSEINVEDIGYSQIHATQNGLAGGISTRSDIFYSDI